MIVEPGIVTYCFRLHRVEQILKRLPGRMQELEVANRRLARACIAAGETWEKLGEIIRESRTRVPSYKTIHRRRG